jgi:hypothetical protein
MYEFRNELLYSIADLVMKKGSNMKWKPDHLIVENLGNLLLQVSKRGVPLIPFTGRRA